MKVVYDDGPTYTFEQFNAIVPKGKNVSYSKQSFNQVYEKYEHKLDGDIREMLFAKRYYGKYIILGQTFFK